MPISYVTGDLSPHVVWMLTEEDIRASVVDTAAVIRRYFPDTPVAYTLGNHETVPVNRLGKIYERQCDTPIILNCKWRYSVTVKITQISALIDVAERDVLPFNTCMSFTHALRKANGRMILFNL
jgi:hypothetical protein